MNNTAKEKGDKYEEFIYDQICKRYENRENVIIYRKKKYPQRIANSSPLEVDISIEIKEYNDRPTEYDNLIIIECKDYARPVSRDVIDHLIRRKEDLRANDAICFSSHGFQSGAIDVAIHSGIKLAQMNQGDDALQWLARKNTGSSHPMHISNHFRQLGWGALSINAKYQTLYYNREIFCLLDELCKVEPIIVPDLPKDVIESLALQTLSLGDFQGYIDIELLIEIIRHLDYQLFIETPSSRYNILGCCDFNKRAITLYMKKQPLGRIAFTLAHEIGHIILHQEILKEQRIDSTEDNSETLSLLRPIHENKIEAQANKFAASLLMPRFIIQRSFDNFKEENHIGKQKLYVDSQQVNQELFFTLIKHLKKITMASSEALSYRLQELSLITIEN